MLFYYHQTSHNNNINKKIIRTQLQANATESAPTIKISSSHSILTSPDPNITEEEIECQDTERKEENDEFIIQKEKVGITQVINKIYSKEGIGGFYRALGSQLICIFVSDMVYFFAVTLIKQILYGKREVDAMSNLKASTIAGIINVFCTSPFWRAQVQLMLQSKKLNKLQDGDERYVTKMCDGNETNEELMNGLFDAWNNIYKKNGIHLCTLHIFNIILH